MPTRAVLCPKTLEEQIQRQAAALANETVFGGTAVTTLEDNTADGYPGAGTSEVVAATVEPTTTHELQDTAFEPRISGDTEPVDSHNVHPQKGYANS